MKFICNNANCPEQCAHKKPHEPASFCKDMQCTDGAVCVPCCPQCESILFRDAVDIGVGTLYGPFYCNNCGWSDQEDDYAIK
jgi:hypothetical protein